MASEPGPVVKLEDQVAAQFNAAQRSLMKHHTHALGLVAGQSFVLRQLESQVESLCVEIQTLRSQLATGSRAAGTGEEPSTSSGGATGGGDTGSGAPLAEEAEVEDSLVLAMKPLPPMQLQTTSPMPPFLDCPVSPEGHNFQLLRGGVYGARPTSADAPPPPPPHPSIDDWWPLPPEPSSQWCGDDLKLVSASPMYHLSTLRRAKRPALLVYNGSGQEVAGERQLDKLQSPVTPSFSSERRHKTMSLQQEQRLGSATGDKPVLRQSIAHLTLSQERAQKVHNGLHDEGPFLPGALQIMQEFCDVYDSAVVGINRLDEGTNATHEEKRGPVGEVDSKEEGDQGYSRALDGERGPSEEEREKCDGPNGSGPLEGRWVDHSQHFCEGRVIAIFPKHWHPEGPSDGIVRTCEELQSGRQGKALLEVGEQGRTRHYEVEQGALPDNLQVIDPTMPGETFRLHFVSAHGESNPEYDIEKASSKNSTKSGGRICSKNSQKPGSGSFELRDAWARLSAEAQETMGSSASLKRQVVHLDLEGTEGTDGNIAGPPRFQRMGSQRMGCCFGEESRFVIHPFSRWRIMWDMSSFLLVIYDMFMIPLDAFAPAETQGIFIMSWITRLFWTFDFITSFMKGYLLASGEIILDPHRCALKYIKTWCFLDAGIVAFDWMEILFRGNTDLGYSRVGRISRVVRVVRIIRLLRIFRMREVMQFVLECISSQKVVIFVDIVKMLIVLLALGHIVACLWYQIGVSAVDVRYTWINVHGYEDRHMWECYMISLHWALSQFAGGMDEITPENLTERLYAVFVYLFAFICALILASNLTSSMTQLNLMGNQNSQQLAVLREYLSQNGVPRKLLMRAQRNAQHALREQEQSMPEENVVLLQKISEPLLIELHSEMYGQTLRAHPFFEAFTEECPQVMSRVCHGACQRMLVGQGDVVFYSGENPINPKMYFVEKGTLNYLERDGRCHPLNRGQWISEASLWTQWEHRGNLVATSPCRFCTINAEKFCEIVSSFGAFGHGPAEQARIFVDHLNTIREEDISDVDMRRPKRMTLLNEALVIKQDWRIEAIFRPLSPLRSRLSRIRGGSWGSEGSDLSNSRHTG